MTDRRQLPHQDFGSATMSETSYTVQSAQYRVSKSVTRAAKQMRDSEPHLRDALMVWNMVVVQIEDNFGT